jgi:hypothetical protein
MLQNPDRWFLHGLRSFSSEKQAIEQKRGSARWLHFFNLHRQLPDQVVPGKPNREGSVSSFCSGIQLAILLQYSHVGSHGLTILF